MNSLSKRNVTFTIPLYKKLTRFFVKTKNKFYSNIRTWFEMNL